MPRKIASRAGGWKKSLAFDPDAGGLQSLRRELQALPYASPRWQRAFSDQIWSQVLSQNKLHPLLIQPLRKTIAGLVAAEAAPFGAIDGDPSSLEAEVTMANLARQMAGIKQDLDQLWDQWRKAVVNILRQICTCVPDLPSISRRTPLMLPLIEHVARPAELIERIIDQLLPLSTDDAMTLRPGCRIASQLKEGLLRESKLLDDAARRNPYRLVPPTQSTLTGLSLVTAYLGGTSFASLLATALPFQLRQRFAHHYIVSTPGGGKTNLLMVLIENDLEEVAAGRATVIVLDSQGDLIRTIVMHPDFAPGGRLHQRLVYIDATDVEHPLALNILFRNTRDALGKRTEYAALLDTLLFLFGAFRQEATGRQETMMRAVAALIQEIPDATLLTLNDIFEPFDKKRKPLAQFAPYLARLNPQVRQFFEVDFNNPATFGQAREQVRARLQALITDDVFRNMFSSPTQKLTMATEMNAGRVILINAYKDLLQSGTEVFGRFFINLIAQATQARANIPEQLRLPTYFYIDECHDYIKVDTNIDQLLSTGRKYKCGVILAHQRRAQISPHLQSATSMAAIKMVRAPVHEDKRNFADQLYTTPYFIDQLPPYSFATHIVGMPSAVALAVPPSRLADGPTMTEAQFQQVRVRMRAKYARDPVPANEARAIAQRAMRASSTAWDSDRGEGDEV